MEAVRPFLPSFPRRRESKQQNGLWIPACAGMTEKRLRLKSNKLYAVVLIPPYLTSRLHPARAWLLATAVSINAMPRKPASTPGRLPSAGIAPARMAAAKSR